MSSRTGIERLLDGYLAEGPESVNDQALMRALNAVDRTNQRRGPFASWKLPPTTSYSRLAAAAVVAAVAIGGALYVLGPRIGVGPALPTATPAPVVSASPSTGPTTPTNPLDTTFWLPFTESAYGYVVAYPSAWQRNSATELWAGQTSDEMWVSRANAPWADKAYHAVTGITVTGLATIVPPGASEEAWIDAYMAPPAGTTPNCTVLAKDTTPIVIDAHPARLAPSCGDLTDALAAFVFVGNRMFVFAISDGRETALFDAYLSTVRLPAPTPSPT